MFGYEQSVDSRLFRTPRKQADVTLETMTEQLDREEAGLTTDRGLEGCAPGLQAFELFITGTFRRKYDKVCCKRSNPESRRRSTS